MDTEQMEVTSNYIPPGEAESPDPAVEVEGTPATPEVEVEPEVQAELSPEEVEEKEV